MQLLTTYVFVLNKYKEMCRGKNDAFMFSVNWYLLGARFWILIILFALHMLLLDFQFIHFCFKGKLKHVGVLAKNLLVFKSGKKSI